MIKTPLTQFESELIEIEDLFKGAKDLKITHLFTETENKVVNTFTFSGKSYAFGNFIKNGNDPIVRKRLIKRYAKLSLYKALSAFYGENKPWGSLTGIRPTKLAYQAQLEGEDVTDFFTNVLKVSKEKTQLVNSVLNAQKGIYSKTDDLTDFFVFIPFCPSRCKYCSFITADVNRSKNKVEEYLTALEKEIICAKRHVKNLKSIYIGGGTPVALSDEQFERVLSLLDDINTGVEFTVEAGRPDRITESKIEIMKRHKVTRICLNPQTFNDKTLALIGRNHTSQDILRVYDLVKDQFIVNMDLIAGLEGESVEDFKFSLDKAISLNPDNITVHTLCVKKGSYLANEKQVLDDNGVSCMVEYAHEQLLTNGYEPYYLYRQKYMAGNLENTGYCKPNKQCVYNINVMEEISNNIACGAGSISKKVFSAENRIERQANPKDVVTYIEKVDSVIELKDKFFS